MNAAATITLQPSGRCFDVPPGMTVLDAALRAGIALPYQCRSGECGHCRARVVAGAMEHAAASTPVALGVADMAAGMRLLCCAQADTAATIVCDEIDGVAGIPLRRTTARVTGIERAAGDIAVLRLELPEGQMLQYRAGQYVQILLRDGRRRSYSLATASGIDGNRELELHVRHRPGGAFTDHVFGKLRQREMLRIEGPFGTFRADAASRRPALLLATGTGFAPIAAIVESLLRDGLARPLTLYWGGRTLTDLYRHTQCLRWSASIPGFRYVPLLSGGAADWSGRRGRVPQAVLDDHADLSGHEVYACGSPAMIATARNRLVAERGLPPSSFFADAFTASH